MRRFSGWALASIVSLGCSGFGAASAAAADMAVKAPPPAPPPVMNWTGFYIGASLGGAWDSPDPQFDAITGTLNSFGGASSWAAGVNAAALYQIGQVVLGLETAYRGMDLKNSVTCPNPTFTCTQKTPDVFTFGGRLGGALDKWLVYADGGYSNTRIKATAFTTATGALFESAAANVGGWYLGVGADYAITPNIIVGLQYTRVNTDNVLLTFPITIDNRSANDKIDIFEVHASFKLWPGLGGPVLAKY